MNHPNTQIEGQGAHVESRAQNPMQWRRIEIGLSVLAAGVAGGLLIALRYECSSINVTGGVR